MDHGRLARSEQSEAVAHASDRREFLKASALSSLAFVFDPPVFAADKPQKFKIGMAATTWLSAAPSLDSYWQAAEAISHLRIGATEADNSKARFDSAYANKPTEFRERSRRTGVYLKGVYQTLYLHDRQKLAEMRSKIHSVARFLKTVGAEYIALGWDVPDAGGKPYQRTPADVRQAIRAADELGCISLEDHGVFVAFHAERDIPKDVILRILDGTNPKCVRLCADVGHLTAVGLDAVQTVRTYASRLAVSHWKDFDPKLAGPDYLGAGARGDFVELGKGIVDFRGLAELYRNIDYEGWVQLELDQTREPTIMASASEMKSFVTDQLNLAVYARHR